MKLFSLILILIFCLCGCESKKNPELKNVSNARVIKTITEKELQDIITNRNGKILFLNVWATWCEPCIEEFPAIVKLDNKYRDNNVEVVGLSVDLPSESGKIAPFLEKQEAQFTVYMADEKSGEKIINRLNPEWSGAIPATFIFDKSGKKQKYLLGAHTYEQLSSGIDSVKSL